MTPDSEIETYLNYFTFLPKEQIRALIEEHRVRIFLEWVYVCIRF